MQRDQHDDEHGRDDGGGPRRTSLLGTIHVHELLHGFQLFATRGRAILRRLYLSLAAEGLGAICGIAVCRLQIPLDVLLEVGNASRNC